MELKVHKIFLFIEILLRSCFSFQHLMSFSNALGQSITRGLTQTAVLRKQWALLSTIRELFSLNKFPFTASNSSQDSFKLKID